MTPPPSSPTAWLAERAAELRLTTAFFLRLPLALSPSEQTGRLAVAAWAFPVVGALAGLAGGLAFAAAMALGLGAWLAAIVAIAVQLRLTGALHEDALADVADGIGGGATRARKLAIMRDSRVGAFGVVALVLALAARLAALATLAEPGAALAALIAAGALSRAAIAPVMAWLPPARADGLGAAAGRPDRAGLCATGAIAVLIALILLGPGAALLAFAAAAGGAAWIAGLARRHLGGQTGDVLGAAQQAAEVAALMAVVAALS